MDLSKLLALGWKPEISLDEGIAQAYRWFLNNEVANLDKPNSSMVGDDYGFRWRL